MSSPSWPARRTAPGVAHRDQRQGDREGDEGEQDRCLVERVRGRENQRHQQDRTELAGPAGGQEVGAEAGLQLAVVAEDRDQGPDRRRRHRRAGVEEGDDDPGCRKQAAEPVGEPDGQRPAQRAQLHRRPLDPLEVDLVAGEEEEHPEAEVGEEVDELVGVGELEDFGADHDSQDQLEDDDRRREALWDGGDHDRGEGGDDHDREKGVGVDRDHRLILWRPGTISNGPC
jgi:hypothetical protein